MSTKKKVWAYFRVVKDRHESVDDGHHHGGRRAIGDPHGDEGRRDHEAKEDHLGRGAEKEDDLESILRVRFGRNLQTKIQMDQLQVCKYCFYNSLVLVTLSISTIIVR
jgi:hypothetical protein